MSLSHQFCITWPIDKNSSYFHIAIELFTPLLVFLTGNISFTYHHSFLRGFFGFIMLIFQIDKSPNDAKIMIAIGDF